MPSTVFSRAHALERLPLLNMNGCRMLLLLCRRDAEQNVTGLVCGFPADPSLLSVNRQAAARHAQAEGAGGTHGTTQEEVRMHTPASACFTGTCYSTCHMCC
jgi:hypothetical protein